MCSSVSLLVLTDRRGGQTRANLLSLVHNFHNWLIMPDLQCHPVLTGLRESSTQYNGAYFGVSMPGPTLWIEWWGAKTARRRRPGRCGSWEELQVIPAVRWAWLASLLIRDWNRWQMNHSHFAAGQLRLPGFVVFCSNKLGHSQNRQEQSPYLPLQPSHLSHTHQSEQHFPAYGKGSKNMLLTS